jgi:hypothetical protein
LDERQQCSEVRRLLTGLPMNGARDSISWKYLDVVCFWAARVGPVRQGANVSVKMPGPFEVYVFGSL